MKLLQRGDLTSRLAARDASRLFVDPLLEQSQVGEVSLDLRLGTDFLVSLRTRRPSIDLMPQQNIEHEKIRDVSSYFRITRRDLGDRFILYPGQIVLTTTLEYIALPADIFVDVITRSSYNRLGVHLNTMIQPGFRGCFPLELFNHGDNAIRLLVGSRIIQARFFETGQHSRYQKEGVSRKYVGNVRPVVSRAQLDPDLSILSKISQT
jgi:dCTP deaminase